MIMENENFDYDRSVKRVEEIISSLESPDMPLAAARPAIDEAVSLIRKCRMYLREMQDSYMEEVK